MTATRAARSRDALSADRILEAAEDLIGELGLEGVSLRQISQAASQKNNFAVQYHFGDLTGLIAAIRAKRQPEIEAARAEYFAAIAREGRLREPRSLLDILYLPLLNLHDGDKRHARFVLALHKTSSASLPTQQAFDAMPLAEQAFQLLAEALPNIPLVLLLERMRLVSFMVLAGTFNRYAPFDRQEDDQDLDSQLLDMATAAICAPVAERMVGLAQAGVSRRASPQPYDRP